MRISQPMDHFLFQFPGVWMDGLSCMENLDLWKWKRSFNLPSAMPERDFPVTELIAYYWAGGARALSRFPNVAEVYMPGWKSSSKRGNI